MQAWQQVKVVNADSGYSGVAGVVVRVESDGKAERVFVRLDADGNPVEPFDAAELTIL